MDVSPAMSKVGEKALQLVEGGGPAGMRTGVIAGSLPDETRHFCPAQAPPIKPNADPNDSINSKTLLSST